MDKFKKIFLFLIVAYIFHAPVFFDNLLEANFHIKIFKFYPLVFLLIPVVYFLGNNILKRKLILPYLKYFLLIVGVFLLMESKYFRGEEIDIERMYIYQLFIIYSIFITLINSGTNHETRKRIIAYSILIIFTMTVMNYLAVFGLLNSLNSIDDLHFSRDRIFTGFFQPDGFSWYCSFGIFLIYVIIDRKLFKISYYWLFSLAALFLGMIMINASRGAFVTIVFFTLVYFLFFQKNLASRNMYLQIALLLILGIISIYTFEILTNKIFIFKRFAHETNLKESRAKQIYVTWANFMKNPLIGVGFDNAAKGKEGGNVNRSNFSYTQILASNGIFYFVIYMHFLMKMFGTNYRKTPYVLYVIYSYIPLMFDQPVLLYFLAITAYLKYYECNLERLKMKSSKICST